MRLVEVEGTVTCWLRIRGSAVEPWSSKRGPVGLLTDYSHDRVLAWKSRSLELHIKTVFLNGTDSFVWLGYVHHLDIAYATGKKLSFHKRAGNMGLRA